MEIKEERSQLKRLVKDKIGGYFIPFSAQFARIVGGINEALFLQQCLYFSSISKYRYCWFYRTKPSMQADTLLSRYQQDKVVKNLKELDLIETQIKGIPPVRYMRVKVDNLVGLLDGYVQYVKRQKDKKSIINI